MFDLSYTKVRTYLNCPWLYKLKIIDDWKAPPSPEAALGLSVHKTLEKFYKEGAARGIEELLFCLDDVWERAGYKSVEQELEFYDKARTILTTYYNSIALHWQGQVQELEKQFFLDLPQINIRLQGIIDRIDILPDQSYALVEYKTHSQPWSEERLASDLQVTFYTKAVQDGLKLHPLRLFFFFVAQGKIIEVTRSGANWQEASTILQETALKIGQKQFEPNTNFCPYCEMNQVCRYSTAKKAVKPDSD